MVYMFNDIIEGDNKKISVMFFLAPTIVFSVLFYQVQSSELFWALLISALDFVILIAYTRTQSLMFSLSKKAFQKELDKMKKIPMTKYGLPKNHLFGRILLFFTGVLILAYIGSLRSLWLRLPNPYFAGLFIGEIGLLTYIFSTGIFGYGFLRISDIKLK